MQFRFDWSKPGRGVMARTFAHLPIVRDVASKTGRVHADERDEFVSALRDRPATAWSRRCLCIDVDCCTNWKQADTSLATRWMSCDNQSMRVRTSKFWTIIQSTYCRCSYVAANAIARHSFRKDTARDAGMSSPLLDRRGWKDHRGQHRWRELSPWRILRRARLRYHVAREILRHSRKRDCFAQGSVRIITIDDHSARWASKHLLNNRQSAKYLRHKGWCNDCKRRETHERRHRLYSSKPHKKWICNRVLVKGDQSFRRRPESWNVGRIKYALGSVFKLENNSKYSSRLMKFIMFYKISILNYRTYLFDCAMKKYVPNSASNLHTSLDQKEIVQIVKFCW